MRNLIKMADEQIESKFETLGYCPCTDDLVFTKETVEDFKNARKEYAQPGQLGTDKEGVLELSNVQVAKGTPRKSLVVIDFGDVRAVYFA